MRTLPYGGDFPDFVLGGFSSAEERGRRPLLVVIWRIGCPTSRFAVPFFSRLQEQYPGASVVGVCQETADDVAQYAEANGLRFRQLVDIDLRVTRQFGLSQVPAYALTGSTGKILEAGIGWDANRMQVVADRLASLLGIPPRPLLNAEDSVPVYKPG